jgi:hypothetical protein
MWLLDLCLSTDFVEPTDEEVEAGALKPFRLPPWDRFASTLEHLDLDQKKEEPSIEDKQMLVNS